MACTAVPQADLDLLSDHSLPQDGTTLATYLEKSPRMPAETAVRIAREIAAGVQELHECGVAHGSLRPSNIMVRFVFRRKVLTYLLHFSSTSSSSRFASLITASST